MKISTRGRYALRMTLELAKRQEDGFISLKDISERQEISKKYLEQIVPMLTRAGILKTTRGNRGGYMLAVSPSACTVGDILRATEGSIAPVACLEAEINECPRADRCASLYIWQGLEKVISDYLNSITVQDILAHEASEGGDDYCI